MFLPPTWDCPAAGTPITKVEIQELQLHSHYLQEKKYIRLSKLAEQKYRDRMVKNLKKKAQALGFDLVDQPITLPMIKECVS